MSEDDDGVRRRAARAWLSLPLVPPAVALGAGIVLMPWVPARVAWAIWACGIVLGVSALCARRLVVGAVALLTAVAALGVLRVTPLPLPADHIARLALPARAEIIGRLVSSPVPA